MSGVLLGARTFTHRLQINVSGAAHPSDLSRRVLASHDEAPPAIELELDVAPGTNASACRTSSGIVT